MTRKIAVLTTTRPVRERIQEIGRSVETLSPRKCADLAREYDLIIIASRASDDFYERIKSALPRKTLVKFRLYSRSFFNRFRHRGTVPAEYDDRDEGWQEILRANGIQFVTSTRQLGSDFTYEERTFHWSHLADFIRDERVTVMS
ncbi:MAG TPA: hypothetical protein VMZ92_12005 [Planctomycetota bacterium]|nr:hypothetical protein [Planctomycetota bacterium]